MKKLTVAALLLLLPLSASAETPDEWVTLGARVHGAFGAFIPLGIKIGLDAVKRLDAKPRELAVLYYDSDTSPCACFADGIAIATYASVGQRTLTIASEKAPPGTAAVIVIRPRQGGAGFKYTIPMTALAAARALRCRYGCGWTISGRAYPVEARLARDLDLSAWMFYRRTSNTGPPLGSLRSGFRAHCGRGVPYSP
jgi:hypothetical protein